MSDTAADAPLRLSISNRSGNVRIDARPGIQLSVRGGTMHHNDDGSIEVTASSSPIEIVCPTDADVAVGTMSGKVELVGRFGVVRVATFSGTVSIDHAATTDVRSTSAHVRIEHCDTECRVVSVSGGIRVRGAGRVDVATQSGQIRVTATEAAIVRSVNGSIKVWAGDNADVRAHAVSSAVTVLVPPGTRPHSKLSSHSGSIKNRLASGSDGSIDVRTESGSIQVAEL